MIAQAYSRSDARGAFPWHVGEPDLDSNRLALVWRPLIDMVDSPLAPVELQSIGVVADWIERGAECVSWFAALGVPGLRAQVLRHAGLPRLDCAHPALLPEGVRTQRWQALVDALDAFPDLADGARALVVLQLAQLSFHHAALDLAGEILPDGDPTHDHYAFELARICARTPGREATAFAVFTTLASGESPLLALAACFQGIGHGLRIGGVDTATPFSCRGRDLLGDDGMYVPLIESRFLRADALLCLRKGDLGAARVAAEEAEERHAQFAAVAADECNGLLAMGNAQYLRQLQLELARHDAPAAVVELAAALVAADPTSVTTRLNAGDACAAVGAFAEAARWYELTGELGTGAGALGWYRAAQCHELLGNRAAAACAFGRCLELDATAVEPRRRLAVLGAVP